MNGMFLSPADRVGIERRIAEEGMVALDPPFAVPDWAYVLHGFSFVPNAFTMGDDGVISRRWVKADEVDWSRTVAARFEPPWGSPLSIEQVDEDEDYC